MSNPYAQCRSVFKQKGKWLVWIILNPVVFYFLILSPSSSFNSVFAQQAKWKWPESFTVGTPGIGSASQLQTASWVPVLDKMTGMKVRVMPEHSASQRLRWLRTGVTDVETDGLPAFVSEGMEARDAYATREGGPLQARVLWACQNMDYGYMVRGDSDVKTIYDLKKGRKRFAICTAIPGAMRSIDALLAWLELKKEDVILVPFNNWKSNILSVVERKADVSLVTIASAAVTEAVASAAGVRILPLPYREDREGAKRFFNTRPTIIFRSIKDGPKEFIGIPSFAFDFFYYVRSDMPADFAYHLAKWLAENHDMYRDKYFMCKYMSIDYFREGLNSIYFPIHEGVIIYLAEKRMWTSADVARQSKNIELLTKYENAYKAAIVEAERRKVRINPAEKEWVDLWNSFKKDLAHFEVY